jgi:phage terminase small subunit
MGERLPATPAGLGPVASALWKKLNREYLFSAGQLQVLQALCEVQDRLVRVRQALQDAPLVLEGKQGQRANPLLATERDLHSTLLRLYRALELHEDPVDAVAAPQPYDSARRRHAALLGHQRTRTKGA